MVHVLCKTVSDIQNAIRFARRHNLRVTIKSTGTDLWGMSSAHDSLNINLREMKEISVILQTQQKEVRMGKLQYKQGRTSEKFMKR